MLSIVGQTPAPLGSTDLLSIDVDILKASCRESDLGLLAGLGSSRSTEAREGAGTGSRCASTSGLEVVATGRRVRPLRKRANGIRPPTTCPLEPLDHISTFTMQPGGVGPTWLERNSEETTAGDGEGGDGVSAPYIVGSE